MKPGSNEVRMKNTPTSGFRQQNRGAAILIFITIVLLATTTLLVNELTVNRAASTRLQDNALVLSQAKEALLGYALSQTVPGTLPCPDSTGDGLQNLAAGGCQSQRGLLPTRTLNLPQLTDHTGSNIWYAVSLNLTPNATGQKNSSSASNLTLDGQASVAVIIAAGSAINGQSRRTLVVTDFLEGNNADGNLADYESLVSADNNDQVLSIEPGHYWSLMERRVLAEANRLLNAYRAVCNEFPWAASFGGPYNSVASQQTGALPFNIALPTNWGAACAGGNAPIPAAWLANQWSDQLYYAMCLSGQGNCLSLIGNVPSAVAGVILAPGISLTGQVRPDNDPGNYFEDENISLPTTQYRKRLVINHSSSYNDISASL